MTSKVENVGQTCTLTHKLTSNHNFQMPSSFVLYLTVRQWKAEDCGILKPVKDTSMLPSEIDQMNVSQLRRQEVKLLDLDVP